MKKYSPVLDGILSGQDEFLINNSESALNDIWMFYDKSKIKEINNDDCVGRYFNVLKIGYSSEKNETYDEGIRALEELTRSESNPSVIRAQKTSLEYLNNLRKAVSIFCSKKYFV